MTFIIRAQIEKLLKPNKRITTSFLGLLVCGDEVTLIKLNCFLGTTGKSNTLYYETNNTLKETNLARKKN